MLKFHQIILRKFLILFASLFLLVGAIVHYWTYEYYIESSKQSLIQDLDLISYTINSKSDLDALAKKIKKNLQLRLTIISKNGLVLAEAYKDKTTMDNHRYRLEIMQADKKDFGIIIRHSHTLNKDMLYVAKKIKIKNKILYIRLAKELKGIYHEFLNLGIKISAVLILFFIVLFIISYKINSQIQYETDKIVKFLKALTKKDKPRHISSNYSQEFALITSLLTKVSKILAKKDKQQEKYTRKLQNSNKQKDDIISAISHEFKNPIAVVNGYSQTLLEDQNINANIRKKFLTKIYNNGTKLSELIDTLRLSMKLDGDTQSIQTHKTNLYELAYETVQTLQLTYPRKHIIIQGDKSVFIDVDKTLFGVVISNLIENALKYSEDEVIVKISQKTLEVIDTGIGINEKDLDNITQKFYRVHQNSWNNSLGLGLFLVNKIIALHHFTLKISSKVNKGSTFSIVF
ncbi:HAMP domain-containing sensor histidine kinase [Sulfurimonas sp.]|uniref:HAMP domain-containing sensor histidine kinase n=1 Tax=Sulfurimonas sp. TaxID=2022749 RepID=UPI0026139C6E|nr:HAMP domain-containing sensor histidine kinase [Sulfurimonas sp.]